ncbi:MAG: hypothetical protein US86_C0009G0014 [Candidatus Daviesbacteria bacterium GW2011_GWA2_38_24]|uniref:Uncharacterized protein n=1 Tax=Candidatus Daviesbacteria bacterium GW2011_GWA2_38_24 TaxID=1618422 RepID=A0A0G0ML56_9BACT|nr:MAG: hypothetical protein US86_C0009G0014 [Candidatus Daviesbacteria bacterium GW2011_GWA2_38_24]KKQ80687.1 MAG: hypothetical protein UT01_C0007G0010 [Candidatus Daviesbacteria bacterium GW2011_GWA1_38_7]
MAQVESTIRHDVVRDARRRYAEKTIFDPSGLTEQELAEVMAPRLTTKPLLSALSRLRVICCRIPVCLNFQRSRQLD